MAVGRARAGRPRKGRVVRDSSGKSRGETVEDIIATALNNRMRETGADEDRCVVKNDRTGETVGVDRLFGFTLGLLHRRHDITARQYSAGDRWHTIVLRHASVMGYSLGSPKSPSFMLVAAGLSCSDAPTPDEIAAIRDQYRLCHDALMSVCRDHGGIRIANTVYAVCVENRPAASLSEADYGDLRLGLNALSHALRKR